MDAVRQKQDQEESRGDTADSKRIPTAVSPSEPALDGNMAALLAAIQGQLQANQEAVFLAVARQE